MAAPTDISPDATPVKGSGNGATAEIAPDTTTPSTVLMSSTVASTPAMETPLKGAAEAVAKAGEGAKAAPSPLEVEPATPTKSASPAVEAAAKQVQAEAKATAGSTTPATAKQTGAKTDAAKKEAAKADGGPKPPLKTVLAQAGSSLKTNVVSAAKDARALVQAMRGKPDDRVVNLTLDNIITALFFSGLLFNLALVKLFKPSWLYLFALMCVGTGLGCAFVLLYYLNRKEKHEINQVLSAMLGLKGLQHILGTLPSWLNYTETEKMEWMNTLLEEVWPYVDKGVCKMVKAQVEQVFEDVLKIMPIPAIKKIGFKQLTFGDAPFRVESIWVNEDTKEGMEMEVQVRWCGDANITLAIELTMGEFTKMCPRVTDILFVGTLRIKLNPLVDKIPGFGAAMVTFQKVPQIKYRLDFGKAMGGSYAGATVRPVIDYVVRSVLVSMLVWPQRLVVPIIVDDEEIKAKIDRMAYRSVGVLKVVVEKAEGLAKADLIGKSDPLAELATDGRYIAETKCIKNTLNPEWNQTFWLLVQEPTNQEMKVWVSDRDFFNAKELVTLKVTNSFGAKELLGRCLVKLKPVTDVSPKPHTQWYHLGDGDWSNVEGCGKGLGRIKLTMTYRPFEEIKKEEPIEAEQGILMVTVNRAINLVKKGKRITAFCRLKCKDKAFLTPPVMNPETSNEHTWTYRNVTEFYHVRFDQDVRIKVMEKSMGTDDQVGVLEVPVSDIAEAFDRNPLTGLEEAGFMHRALKLEEADRDASLHVTMRYVPCS